MIDFNNCENFIKVSNSLMAMKSAADSVCRRSCCDTCPLNIHSTDDGRCFKDDLKDIIIRYTTQGLDEIARRVWEKH